MCFWVDGWAELSFVVAVGTYLLGAESFRQALMLPSLSVLKAGSVESTLSNAQHQGCCQPWGRWMAAMIFGQALMLLAFSTIAGKDCHLLRQWMMHTLA